MLKPGFITFTGADDAIHIGDMQTLVRQCPIEWGILFSPSLQGMRRYPSLPFVQRLLNASGLYLSAHLCGDHSPNFIETGCVKAMETLLANDAFGRVQVNTSDPAVSRRDVRGWAQPLGMQPILRSRDVTTFPVSTSVHLLFDRSGGQDVEATAWPAELTRDRLVGFAGGLKPDSVAAAVDRIGERAGRYWIDMDSGVCDQNDRFDIAACRAVCEAVYGEPFAQPKSLKGEQFTASAA